MRFLRPAAWLLLVAVALALAAIIWLPEPMASRTHGLKPADHADAVASARTALLAFFAGVVAVASAGVAYAGYRLSRRGQITDRLARAIDQVGNKDSEAARIGGIYTLEHLAREIPSEQQTVMEILAAVVRTQSRPQPPPQHEMDIPEAYSVTADIQAALTVIGRRDLAHDDPTRLSLAGADLRGADLRGAQLQLLDLTGADLRAAQIRGASFAGATLNRANLARLDFRGVDLTNANLQRADITHALVTTGQAARAQQPPELAIGLHSVPPMIGLADGTVDEAAERAYLAAAAATPDPVHDGAEDGEPE